MRRLSWSQWNPIELIAPKVCLLCGATDSKPLCATCLNELEPVFAGGCRACGNPSVHGDATRCWWCERLNFVPVETVACFAYRGVGQGVHQLIKFQHYWRLIGTLSGRFIGAFLKADAFLRYECLCPIPETALQKFRRPFHPAGRIAEALSRGTGIPQRKLLRVAPWTRRQVGLDLIERRRNLKGKFSTSSVRLPHSVLLVDDVLTTGTTMESASLALKSAGVSRIGWFALFRTV